MHQETDDAAVQADAYIDALLAGHGRVPVAVEAEPELRDAIRLLERGLPRFHPSFVFEDWLSSKLRRAADNQAGLQGRAREPAEIVQIVIRPQDTGTRNASPDRRLLLGGAIASGVSIAGAAVLAWRRTRHVHGGAD